MTQPPHDPWSNSSFGEHQFGAGQAPPVFTSSSGWQPQGGQVNTFATLSVIFAFVFAPAGAVLGHLALGQIHRTGEPGRQRALVGIVISYTVILLAILGLVLWLAFGGKGGEAAPGPVNPGGGGSGQGPNAVAPQNIAVGPPTPIAPIQDDPACAAIIGVDGLMTTHLGPGIVPVGAGQKPSNQWTAGEREKMTTTATAWTQAADAATNVYPQAQTEVMRLVLEQLIGYLRLLSDHVTTDSYVANDFNYVQVVQSAGMGLLGICGNAASYSPARPLMSQVPPITDVPTPQGGSPSAPRFARPVDSAECAKWLGVSSMGLNTRDAAALRQQADKMEAAARASRNPALTYLGVYGAQDLRLGALGADSGVTVFGVGAPIDLMVMQLCNAMQGQR